MDTCVSTNSMTLVLERSMNSHPQTDGHGPRRTRTVRVRTEAPGLPRFSRPPVHWPRAAAPPPLLCHWLLPGAAGCRLSPMPHCEGRLRGAIVLLFQKLHQGQGPFNSCESSFCFHGKVIRLETHVVSVETALMSTSVAEHVIGNLANLHVK